MSPLVELEPPIVKERQSNVLVETPVRSVASPPAEQAPPREKPVTEAAPEPFLVNRLELSKPKPVRKQAASVRPRPAVIRTAFYIVGITAATMFAGRLARFAVEPVAATYRTGLEIRGLQASLSRDQATNAHLQQDIAYLKTHAGIEQEARRRGWVMPGETALSIVAPEEPATAAPTKPVQPHQAISERIRSAIDTCLAVLGGKPKK